MAVDPNKSLAKAQITVAKINARAASAHDRAILNIARATSRKPQEIEALLAAGSLAIFGLVTAAILFHVVPAPNEKYAMLLLGALIGVVKDCFARYFSVTKAASLQRDTIADMARASADTAKVVAATTPVAGAATVTAAPDVDITVRDASTPPPAAS